MPWVSDRSHHLTGLVNQPGVDAFGLVYCSQQEAEIAQRIDQPTHTAGVFVDPADRILGKDLVSTTGCHHAGDNIVAGLFGVEGRKVISDADPLIKLRVSFGPRLQFRLSYQDQRQQEAMVQLEVEQ